MNCNQEKLWLFQSKKNPEAELADVDPNMINSLRPILLCAPAVVNLNGLTECACTADTTKTAL